MNYFLVPKVINIGDEAEMYISFSDLYTNDELLRNWIEKDIKMETDKVSISKIKIKELHGKKFLSITFQVWDINDVQFPSLEEYGIYSALPSVKVYSLLDNTDEQVICEDAHPVLIPGTVAFIITAVAIIAVLISLFPIIIKKISRTPKKKNILRKYKRKCRKNLKHKNYTRIQISELDTYLRQFIQNFFDCFNTVSIMGLTYSEIITYLQQADAAAAIMTELKIIFTQFESVKFNSAAINKSDLQKTMELFFKLCEEKYDYSGK